LHALLPARGPLRCAALAAAVGLVACAPQPKHPKSALDQSELAQVRYLMADQLVGERDYDRALPYLQMLRARYPQDLRIRLLLAIVLREKGTFTVAERELLAVLRQAPRSPHAHAAYGVLLDKTGRHAKAEQHHRQALRLQPGDPRYHNDLGFCLFLQKRFGEAKEAYLEAIRIDPGMRLAFNNLGFVYGLDGDDSGALRAFRQAGSQAMALTNMGLVAELRGKPQVARRYYERALRAAPGYPPALRNLQALDPQVHGTADDEDARPAEGEPSGEKVAPQDRDAPAEQSSAAQKPGDER
jgi:Flp pilus assembly protein TadD